MKLLNIYEDKDEAEQALRVILGEKRLASERDGTVVIYNLFGEATWGNFYRLNMFDLVELKRILTSRDQNSDYDLERHREIIKMLGFLVRNFEIKIPTHWLLDE